MNILIVTGSPRKGGNTEIMAELFEKEADRRGHSASFFRLSENMVLPCVSCGYCRKSKGKCPLSDDMWKAAPLIEKAQAVVFASPVYDHGFSAQIVAFFNRLNAYNGIFSGPKVSALLLNSGLPGEFGAASMQYAKIALERKWRDGGVVAISGMNQRGDRKNKCDPIKFSQLVGKMECLLANT